MSTPAPELSVVVPAYNEEEVLPGFHHALVATLDELGAACEVVYVDDGSRDATADLLRDLARGDERVRYLVLSRNFGHQLALRAGMDAARGRAVVCMDSDLQHPPAEIARMLALWRQGDVDTVVMVREAAQPAGPLKRWTARAFYALFNRISEARIHPGGADFRLMDRRVVDQLLACRDQRPFYRGLIGWSGGRVRTLGFRVPPRPAGESKYSLLRMLAFALDGIFSFSLFPVRVLFGVTAALAVVCAAYAVHVGLVHFVWRETVPGWTSVVGMLLLIFFYLSLALAILGEYVGRIYLQSLGRPAYLVAETEAGPAPALPGREGPG